MAVIDMQTMRYINLLERESRVKTRKCFFYNNTIVFAVPRAFLAQAIGRNAEHIHSIQDRIGKRIKVVIEAGSIEDAERFVADIVAPVTFTCLEIKDDAFVLTAGMQSKAALIGRNRRREDELRQIMKDTFGKDLKIV
jgi:transcription antitermination factor NusA-like protein